LPLINDGIPFRLIGPEVVDVKTMIELLNRVIRCNRACSLAAVKAKSGDHFARVARRGARMRSPRKTAIRITAFRFPKLMV
jgi:hypothetical protein